MNMRLISKSIIQITNKTPIHKQGSLTARHTRISKKLEMDRKLIKPSATANKYHYVYMSITNRNINNNRCVSGRYIFAPFRYNVCRVYYNPIISTTLCECIVVNIIVKLIFEKIKNKNVIFSVPILQILWAN